MPSSAVESTALYEHVFHTQFPSLMRLAALLGADDPENVAQEAFVRVHAALPRLRDQNAVLHYLRRTVVNQTRSGHRHLSVVGRRHRELLPALVESAEDTAIRSDTHRALLQAVAQLRPQQREVLILRYWTQLSVEETADVLGVAAGTVKSTTSRAMAALARLMGEGQ